MKKSLLILAIGIVLIHPFGRVVAGNHDVSKATVINQYDTVVFDLTKAVIAGNLITFPVYMLTDDTDVVALDFSLKYNLTKLAFDTILTVASYVQPTFNQDGTKTIRFTSFSIGPNYGNDTSLVYIRFNWLSSGQICDADLDSVKGYLNGTACSVKVPSSCLAVAVQDVRANTDLVSVYPSPATEILNVETPEHSTIQLSDMKGREIMIDRSAGEKHLLNTQHIVAGIYMLKIYNDNFTVTKKIVIY